MKEIDILAKFPFLKKLIMMRGFQFFAILPNLFVFYLFIIAGIYGTPVGNKNIMIVFVWIFWWFMLIAIMLPFGGRIWCTMCPLPAVGEWMQRLSFFKVRYEKVGEKGVIKHKFFGLNKVWPKKMQNIWGQNIGFLLLACFSPFLLTRPLVSVFVLGGLIVISTVLAMIYKYRVFCMYLCPISGFLSLYSMTSNLALRAKDFSICKEHKIKECFVGTDHSYPCPWFQTTFNMTRNNYCGLCMECVKSCSLDNITLYWRPFCSENELKGYDECWKAFIMVSLALVYSVNLLGPWGKLKDWANFTETGQVGGFLILSIMTILLCLVILPGIYYLFALLSKKMSGYKEVDMKTLFIKYCFIFVPLGLLGWIAFSIPLVMINLSYIIAVISDPLGLGWDLFGTAHIPWRPLIPGVIPFLQIPILLSGIFFALNSVYKIGQTIFPSKKMVIKSLIPIGVLVVGITAVFLRLFIG